MDHSRQQPFQTTKLVFGLSLVAALAGWGLYAYLFHEVSSTARATVALSSESAKLEDEQSKEMELKTDLAANQARQPVLNSYFVDASDPVPLFETLEGYGRDTNVAVVIDSVDVKKSPNRLIVSVTGDGDFADVYRFVALLEAAPYEFTVSAATIHTTTPQQAPAVAGKSAPKPTAAVWEARITLSIASVTGIPASAPSK